MARNIEGIVFWSVMILALITFSVVDLEALTTALRATGNVIVGLAFGAVLASIAMAFALLVGLAGRRAE